MSEKKGNSRFSVVLLVLQTFTENKGHLQTSEGEIRCEKSYLICVCTGFAI